MANRSTMISDSDPMEKDNSIKKGTPMEKRDSIEGEYSKEKGKSTEKEFSTKKKQPGEDVTRHKEEKGREKSRQDGEQKHRSAERGGKRRLRVYRGGNWERYPVPQLRLEGKWLGDYGFLPGTPIEVSCTDGQLLICKAPTISVLVIGSRSISAFDLSPFPLYSQRLWEDSLLSGKRDRLCGRAVCTVPWNPCGDCGAGQREEQAG